MTVLLIAAVSVLVPYTDYYTDLWESLFAWHTQGEDMILELEDFADYPVPDERLQEYIDRWNRFETGIDFDQFEYWEQEITAEKQAGVERGIIALIDHPDIEELALEYVQEAPLFYEWEGDPATIGQEAQYTLNYLRENPDTPLAPALMLMALHRMKAQQECLAGWYGGPSDSLQAVYDSLLLETVIYPDTLVNVMAVELDSRDYVYIIVCE